MTKAEFHILLSLAGGKKHGYEIMKQINADTNDGFDIGPGSLYGTIDNLQKQNLVSPAGTKRVNNRQRIFYQLTKTGHKTLKAELKNYTQVIKIAKKLALI